MGFRFRKSVKIAPGVKLNFSKKSVGMSVGSKYGGVSFNSKNGTRVRASAPGTGLSYSTKFSGSGKSTAKSSSKPAANNKPVFLRWWYIALIVLFAVGGIGNVGTSVSAAILGIAIAAAMGVFTLKAAALAKENAHIRNGELLELQKLVLKDSTEELVMSEKQLKELAEQAAEGSLKIMNDCSNTLQSTTSPDVFFYRLQLFNAHCQKLVSLEKYIEFSGTSPSELYSTLCNEKQDLIRTFIMRYLDKVNANVDDLKTEKGKMNQYQKFYDSLKPYFSEMNSGNITYVEAKYRAYANVIS